MIGIDTNLLVYSHRGDSPWHAAAVRVVRELAEGSAIWAIPWPCIHEFLAIVTHPRIFNPPTPLARAIDQVDAWLASPSLALLAEEPGYWGELQEVFRPAQAFGPLVHDARVAALCRLHGVRELWTADRDFGRFPGLSTRNPLVG